ncbi:ER membrane protein complex subunit 1-like isoform X2 [Mytilus californianus]|uniref:ER membrane protein complex subunit 1-like isoform X2 n=1 Tax=Mytilus californianus TaxID=6549 RepID=UPI002247ECFF|nr:ER membrane protein complex subunit 1-like isoform X2 [Mytilus californianus]
MLSSIVKVSFFLLITAFLHVSCLYEDQVGKFDWTQRYIGKVERLYWDQSNPSKKLLVTTDKNVLASIHVYNGSIAWRQILEDNDRGTIDAVFHQDKYFVGVCGGGRYVRSWKVETGALSWENTVHHIARPGADIKIKGNDQVIALTHYGVYSYDLMNGKQKWKFSLPNSDGTVFDRVIVRGNEVIAIGHLAGAHVTIVKANNEGVISSQKSIPAAWISKETSCEVVDSSYYLCFKQDTSTLQLLDLVSGPVFKPTDISELGLTPSGTVVLEPVSNRGDYSELLIRLGRNDLAILKIVKNELQVVKQLPSVSAAEVTKLENKEVLLTLQKSGDQELTLTGYDLESGGEITDLKQKISAGPSHGLPFKAYGYLVRKKDGRIGYKLALQSEDYSLQMVQKMGKVSWTNEEAMAYIMSVEMIDLPVSENQAKFEEEFGSHKDDIGTMFVKRLSTQLSQLKTFLQKQLHKLQGHRHHLMENSDGSVEEEEDEDEDEEMTRDEFNLNKMIVIVTSAGKIYGMKSTNGKIAWSHFMPKLSPFDRYKKSLPLFVQRTTAHFPNPPQCAILGRDMKTGHGVLYAFNPITGVALSDMPPEGLDLGYNVQQAYMVGEMDENFLKGIVLMDSDNQIHVYPPSYKSVASRIHSSLYMMVVDLDKGMLNGYRVSKDLKGEKVWNVNLQKKQQIIKDVVFKRYNEHVHSQGRVLGDRSVLYKYINPNLAVVVAEGEDTSSSSQKSPGNFVNIYLIDSVKGHIVFHGNHRRAKGPVHIIHSENWVVYDYYNQKSRRKEVSVLELFEGKEQSNSTAFSSHTAPHEPLVLRQSFILPMPIYTMATTITEKGITSKSVLFALVHGGLLSLPKAFIDPRRPVIPTQETMEEGIIPYIPELPVSTEAIINYNQSIYNIIGIHTSPAGLESTSLVLAYGLDLFFTRVQPSKMFDVLKEDFDFYLISLVMLAMILVTLITQKLAARKALNKAWK